MLGDSFSYWPVSCHNFPRKNPNPSKKNSSRQILIILQDNVVDLQINKLLFEIKGFTHQNLEVGNFV